MEKIIAKREDSHFQIWLNKPKKLNTLDEQLVQEFQEALNDYETSGLGKLVIKAVGPKSFCAGGDVVSVVEGVKSGRPYDFFFKQEYALDQRLYQTKGVIGHAHGIVMGGGLGVLMGCETRLLDPKAILAMPEVTIGFFPDVGASYFLQSLPKKWRLFMTLTGARLNAFDFLALGLVDGLCPIEAEENLLFDNWKQESAKVVEELASEKEFFSEKDNLLTDIEKMVHLKEFDEWARATVELGVTGVAGEWLKNSLATYLQGSPVSKVLTWDYFHWCEGKSREACFEKDLELADIVSNKGDFAEGVRALLVDKDKSPRWRDQDLASCQSRLEEDLTRLFSV